MTKTELINTWNRCTNDQLKWGIIFDYKDELPKDMYIQIDNDDVFISFEDDDTILNFDEFGYYALYELLQSQGINADYV